MEINFLLYGCKINCAMLAHALFVHGICNAVLAHDLAGALNNALDASATDEHVVPFFGEHEAGRSCQRIETGRRQRLELHLAIAICKRCEHEERQPVGRGLIKCTQDSWLVRVARGSFKQIFGFFSTVPAEVLL